MKAISRILIADDHPLFREALRHVVDRVCPAAQFVEVASYAQMIAATTVDDRFDVIFLDLMMPGGDVLAELRRLRERIPFTPVIVVSSREDRTTIRAVIECGVAGYIRKSESRTEMESAIARVIAGEVYFPGEPGAGRNGAIAETLTPRQSAVLEQLVKGRSNRQIATILGIEEITVKVHISAILRKLGVKNRLAAVVAARALLDGNLSTEDVSR